MKKPKTIARRKSRDWLALLQRRQGVAGSSVCLLNTGISAEYVVDRYVAGESINSIAEDYYLSPTLIEAAIRCCLLVKGTSLYSKQALAKLDELVPMREPYNARKS